MLNVPPIYINLADQLRLKQCRYGPMLFLANDRYIGGALDKYGEFSEGEVHLFRQLVQPNWTVMDVGANHGTHTVALAQIVGAFGRVYAFEPQRVLFQLVCANLALNSLGNVYAYCGGVGRELGFLNVPQVDYTRPNNFGALEMGGIGGDSVPLVTIDSLTLPQLHFAKIDAEGMEGDVIIGATETIARYRPLLYMENDREDKSPALIQQMWDLDYELYYHIPFYYNRYNFYGVAENIYGGTISVNMLCVPNDKPITVPNECHPIKNVTDTWRICV
ncbi:MAG: FkbM family methyltransferase [Candidatus Omnitrophota bacterium]|jgi:FkbM family methyltransferase